MSGLQFFFFNDTATTEIYTLSLHDALPILLDWFSPELDGLGPFDLVFAADVLYERRNVPALADLVPKLLAPGRSEEHTSELQSRQYLVCRLLLEKKKSICQFP